MRRAAAALALAGALLLTGCGLHAPLEERIAEREKCLDAGGEWIEWLGGANNINHWCDLSTTKTKKEGSA